MKQLKTRIVLCVCLSAVNEGCFTVTLMQNVQVEEWLSEVDFDGDGVLSYEEFKMCFMANVSGM